MDTVPIVVDSLKTGVEPPGELVRCIYFSIECSLPAGGWEVRFGQVPPIPMLMLNLSGIVLHPPGKPEGFTSPVDIADLIDLVEGAVGVEGESPIYLDVNDLWIPRPLFRRAGLPEPAVGAVCRISPRLFRACYAYRNGLATWRQLAEYAEMIPDQEWYFAFSKVETESFAEWKEKVIHRARQYNKEKHAYKLERGDADSPGMR